MKSMLDKVSALKKFDFSGVYYLEAPDAKGKIVIPIDLQVLKQR